MVYKFIDLFAGIGGIRLAFEKATFGKAKCKCVFSSEWNNFSQITYEANFGNKPFGDITQIPSSDIPDHDILLAGFPCQPFSLAGIPVKKMLNRPNGFDDKTQGTLFFEIKRILEDKQPSAFFLENVKNLQSHDKKKTFKIIMETLEEELGYHVHYRVMDSVSYVPQHRERIYIVGFKDNLKFSFPEPDNQNKPALKDILETDVDPKYTLTDGVWNSLQRHAEKHSAKGNGFGYGLADINSHSRTLTARYHKDGAEILIPQDGRNPRRLTPVECMRLMGFNQLKPDFKIPVSDCQAYRQFGNSVVVPVIHAIAKEMVKSLKKNEIVEDSNPRVRSKQKTLEGI